ncbi:MAG: hypothetical protein KAS17_11950, partial [Victivallaceae bacterium]|nr:hypothetical protein [Victivallaceae bacterium]
MKTAMTCLIVALTAGFLYGATPRSHKNKKNITTEEILSKIDATAKSLHSFQASFQQTEVDSVFNELYESTGKFYFNKMICGEHREAPV